MPLFVRLMLSKRALVKQRKRLRSPMVQGSASSWIWPTRLRLRSACSRRLRTTRISSPPPLLRARERWPASLWRLLRLFRVSIATFIFLISLSFFCSVFGHSAFFVVVDAAGIEFDRGALEHGSALD